VERKLQRDQLGVYFVERQDNRSVVSFEKWHQEMWQRVQQVPGRLENSHVARLRKLGCHEPSDHVFVVVAKGTDRYLVTEDSDLGKGHVNRGRALERNLLARHPVLAEIIRRLVKACQPERIYLFGSMARGDAGPDSDYDTLVLVEHPTEPLYRLSLRGFRALRGIDAAVDMVVWDRATFDARLHLPASSPATVVRERRLLHAA
jgi:predicted nucleotidyltransferase